MKTKKIYRYYSVNYAINNDGTFHTCQLFDRLTDARAFASTLSFKWEIRRRVDAPFQVLEDTIISHSIDPNARYHKMARLAARRLARFTA